MEYRKSISKNYVKLSKEEQLTFNKKRLEGDTEARDTLINSCLPLVVKIAEKFSINNKHIDMDDLVQEGNIALIKAVDKWNPEKSSSVTTLVYHSVNNALINVVHKSQYKIKNPLSLTGYASKMISKINAVNSKDPNVISEKTGISVKTIKKMLSKTGGTRKSIDNATVTMREAEIQEEEENPVCLANLYDLIKDNIKEPSKSIFMDFYGLSSKRRKRALEISKERGISIKEVNSIVNKTKTLLSKIARDKKIA